MSKSDLLALQVGAISGLMDPEDVTDLIQATNSLWIYPGVFRKEVPHAKLTSEKCSTGFVNVREVIFRTNLCDLVASQMVMRLRLCYQGAVNCVIGSDTAAGNLAYAVGRLLGACVYPMHKVKTEIDGKQAEEQTYTGPKLPAGWTVLRVEDLITTKKSVCAVKAGFSKVNPEAVFLPYVLSVVDRRDDLTDPEVDGGQLISLVQYKIQTWEPGKCPLCDLGSKAIRPNTPAGWAELTQAVA